MIKLREAVIVEGKYDKQKLLKIVDALVIETHGFRIFKDKVQREYIKKLARERGLLIITDSDSAGFMIRNHLKSLVPNSEIRNAYIPKIEGKESRKKEASKEGVLGVEGVENEIIERAIRNSGAVIDEPNVCGSYTRLDLFNLGITGGENSEKKRKKLLSLLLLPEYLTTSALLKYMNLNSREVEKILGKYLSE